MDALIKATFYLLFLIVCIKCDPEDCRKVGDACPVWDGWSDPKCHVDD